MPWTLYLYAHLEDALHTAGAASDKNERQSVMEEDVERDGFASTMCT